MAITLIVSKEIKDRLNIATLVIRKTRELLNRGQENQENSFGVGESTEQRTRDYMSQVNRGWKSLKVEKTRSFFSFSRKKNISLDLNTEIKSNLAHPQRIAGIALHMRIGRCQEFASVAYLLLRSYLGRDDEVWYVMSNNSHHYYCLVVGGNDGDNFQPGPITMTGDDNSNKSKGIIIDTAIVVDPWIGGINHTPPPVLYMHSMHKESYPAHVLIKRGKGMGISTNREANELGKILAAKDKYTQAMINQLNQTEDQFDQTRLFDTNTPWGNYTGAHGGYIYQ